MNKQKYEQIKNYYTELKENNELYSQDEEFVKRRKTFQKNFSIDILKTKRADDLLEFLFQISGKQDSVGYHMENGLIGKSDGNYHFYGTYGQKQAPAMCKKDGQWVYHDYHTKDDEIISKEEALIIADKVKDILIKTSQIIEQVKNGNKQYDDIVQSFEDILKDNKLKWSYSYFRKYLFNLYPDLLSSYISIKGKKKNNIDKIKDFLNIPESEREKPLSMEKRLYENFRGFSVNDIYHTMCNLIDNGIELTGTITQENGEVETMANNKMQNQPLNQILYGPPGTGKTYNTVVKAMEIIGSENVKMKDERGNFRKNYSLEEYKKLKEEFNKYKNDGQIEFITFHQSYSYEEFVEGIKPIIKRDSDCSQENDKQQQISYEYKDGVFKEICEHAKPILASTTKQKPIDFSNTKVFKMSLGNTLEKEDDIYNYCIENDVVSLGWANKDFSKCESSQDFKNLDDSWGATALERFVKWMDIGDIIIISNGNRKFRAIAQVESNYYYDKNTPISHTHFRKVKWLYHGEDIHYSKINNKIFSQQSIYGYFDKKKKGQQNYNPDLKVDELNKIITGELKDENTKPYILIIDEINRGNISKIFGELITLIEEDKRENVTGDKEREYNTLKVTLPYSGDEFFVPNNLYIIGTMNTADKSLALLDVALRRRFEFVPMYPQYKDEIHYENENYSDILKELNNQILIKKGNNADYLIGHSYFLGKEPIADIFNKKVIPLLMEYFNGKTKEVYDLLNNNFKIEFDDKYMSPDNAKTGCKYYYLQVKKESEITIKNNEE